MRTNLMIRYLSSLFLLSVLGAVAYVPSPKQESPKHSASITVAEETLAQAANKGFDYYSVLGDAESRCPQSITALMRFCEETDAAGSLGHGVVLVELLNVVGDLAFADVAKQQPSKVKAKVAKSLLAGEDYVHPSLPKPICELYPHTCEAVELEQVRKLEQARNQH